MHAPKKRGNSAIDLAALLVSQLPQIPFPAGGGITLQLAGRSQYEAFPGVD